MKEYTFYSRRGYLRAMHHMARLWTDRPFFADELLAYYDYDDAIQSFKLYDECGNHTFSFLREFGRPTGTAFVVPRGETKPKIVGTDMKDYPGFDFGVMLAFHEAQDKAEAFDRYFPNDGLRSFLKFKDWLACHSTPLFDSKKKRAKESEK